MSDDRPRCEHLVVYPMENCPECLRARVAALENAIDAHRTMTLQHEDGPGAWDRSLWMLLEEVEL